ncbi:MAG: 50S ribosomal protein L18Ae, partial [Candidatus Heimdallarchaeota archaeon]
APKKATEPIVKVFLAEGSYREKKNRIIFKKEVRALTPEHVKERIYRDLGSRHRLKMRDISFSAITEIDPSDPKVEIRDPSVKFLASEEAKKLALPVR